MVNATNFTAELEKLDKALSTSKRVLITAPGAADGDSIGAQLALRRMLLHKNRSLQIFILNDEELPHRYQSLPDSEVVYTPERFAEEKQSPQFDIAFIVDGGIDRAGRVREVFDKTPCRVFIDHHAVSVNYPYDIKIVDSNASATTELVFHLSQTKYFQIPVGVESAQHVYLGLIFDTGFFRHSNTTPEVMELGAKLIRSGFDFTRVGERGMLERSFPALKLYADTLTRTELANNGKIIWSTLTKADLKKFGAEEDDREGIIDQLFLTHGIEVAVLFFEIKPSQTKMSFRSQGAVDVATFARSLTERGGGHTKAAGALLEKSLNDAVPFVLQRLEAEIKKVVG